MATATTSRAARIEVHGTVQGVGFRPFVYRLATAMGLAGDVRNAGGHVEIRVRGADPELAALSDRLVAEAPPAARISRLLVTDLPATTVPEAGFRVVASGAATGAVPEVPPDLATCAACVRELFDPADRRHRYPFLNCADCGPRATVIEDLPYDRARTTMSRFPMCSACRAEYLDPANRRFHAEPIACADCGPRLAWHPAGADEPADVGVDALAAAEDAIARGGLVAVKGIGGYQLVCDASAEAALTRLRAAKHRPGKPFAIMVGDLRAADRLVPLDEEAAALLGSPARPVVLLPRRDHAPVAAAVAPNLPVLGVFLPYSPLHHLLLADLARPLVVTSGNRSGEPIATEDRPALTRLGPLTDGVLAHDRPITARYDDSVCRVVAGRPTTVRRARGYAPAPRTLPVPSPRPLLAVGGHLKNTVTLVDGDHAVLGPHVGDLADADTLDAFHETIRQLTRLHAVDPDVVVHDAHPGYLSSQYARRRPASRRLAVQHHHAHVAATAAEHGLRGPFLGVAYDGLGLGDDGTLWGGEILLASLTGYRRVGRFGRAPLPGGEAAVRRPARTALGYLLGAEPLGSPAPELPADGPLGRLPRGEVELVRRMIDRGVNCPPASSAGRLFDAVACLLGLGGAVSYEGEAAVRLEAAAHGRGDLRALAWRLVRRDGLWVYDPLPTLRDVLTASREAPVAEVAARFHTAVAEATAALVEQAAAATGVRTVCLGGGVFQNQRLTRLVLDRLAALDLTTHLPGQVPTNDGGLSFGQAAVAAAVLTGG